MIYLVYMPSSRGFEYWIVHYTNVGATCSASTPQDAIVEFEHETFNLTDNHNNYTITDQYILSGDKYYGDILAKAPTIRHLIDTYPEYFI